MTACLQNSGGLCIEDEQNVSISLGDAGHGLPVPLRRRSTGQDDEFCAAPHRTADISFPVHLRGKVLRRFWWLQMMKQALKGSGGGGGAP